STSCAPPSAPDVPPHALTESLVAVARGLLSAVLGGCCRRVCGVGVAFVKRLWGRRHWQSAAGRCGSPRTGFGEKALHMEGGFRRSTQHDGVERRAIGAVVPKSRGIRGPYRWLTPTDRKVIEERLRAGETPRVIVADVGCSEQTVCRVRRDLFMRRRISDSGFRLSFEDRVEIGMGIARGESNAEIGRQIAKHRSTVGREIARCQSRGHYRPWTAQRRADREARRPRATKLSRSPRLV